MPPQERLPNVDCRFAIARGKPTRALVPSAFWLCQLGAVQVELGGRDYPYLWEILLQGLDEFRSFADNDQARRAIEVFLGERANVFARDRVDRRNEFVQRVQRQIVGGH